MSLKSLPIPPVPEETARVAHTVFPRGNVFMQVRDTASNHLQRGGQGSICFPPMASSL
jgi:hypothetical protein